MVVLVFTPIKQMATAIDENGTADQLNPLACPVQIFFLMRKYENLTDR